jgi:hypothetical protein
MVNSVLGCAGTGQVVPLQVRSNAASDSSPTKATALSVGVVPFEDARPDTTKLGVRHHLGGGESYFNLTDGKVGDKVAEVIAEHLRQKGWRAEVVKDADNASLKMSMASEPSGAVSRTTSSTTGYDVTLGGKVLDLSANADSGFMKTAISVTSKVLVQGLNAGDGSTVRMTVNGAGKQTVFWFEPKDIEAMLNEVLSESLEKLDADMKVEDKVLRLK